MDVVAPAHDQERKRADDSRILGLFAIVSNLFCLLGPLACIVPVCSVLAIRKGVMAGIRLRRENLGGVGTAVQGVLLGVIALVIFAVLCFKFVDSSEGG